jgi:Chromosome segregation ATPases
MKKLILSFIVLACFMNVSAQIEISSSGNVGIGKDPQHKLDVAGDIYMGSASNILGTTNDNSITFKVNNVLAGYTGYFDTDNVSFGYGSLLNSSAGTYNTAVGSSALRSNTTTANYNTAIGSSALYFNTTGVNNTATGHCALYLNESGNYNTAHGLLALSSNTTGDLNTACGFLALSTNTTGGWNTAIGYNAGNNGPTNLTNSTAIGCNSVLTASNQVRIGNGYVTSIGGYANWSNISDGRAKKNIRADVPGLDFINLLQPVTYNLDLNAMDNLLGIDKAKKNELEKEVPQELKDISEKARKSKEDLVQTGFVAQDVEKTAKSIGYKFSGVNVDESGIYSLSYAEFVVPLVKAVQELSDKNDQLQEQVEELGDKNDRLQKQVEELAGLVNKLLNKEIGGLRETK